MFILETEIIQDIALVHECDQSLTLASSCLSDSWAWLSYLPTVTYSFIHYHHSGSSVFFIHSPPELYSPFNPEILSRQGRALSLSFGAPGRILISRELFLALVISLRSLPFHLVFKMHPKQLYTLFSFMSYSIWLALLSTSVVLFFLFWSRTQIYRCLGRIKRPFYLI